MTLEPGDLIPDFTLPDETGQMVSLADFAGGPLIVYFYPKAFTPGCTTQACDFRDRHDALAAAGYQIVGVSPDSPGKLAKFRAKHGLPFRMLADEDHAVAEAFGAWGVKKNYGREYEGIIRSTFFVGPDGTLEKAWRNVKATGHADRVLAEIS